MNEEIDQKRYILFLTLIIAAAFCVIMFGYWSIIFPTLPQCINLVGSVSALVFGAWMTKKSELDAHILRWPFALWCAGWALMLGTMVSMKHPDAVWFGWVLALPFVAFAAYSFIQVRKPNGKQLELPMNFVHGVKRLEWRWFTSPKLDFWPCWIGLLFPAALGVALYVCNWNEPLNAWLTILKLGGGLLFGWFAVSWITAPKDRKKYRQLTLAVGWFRWMAIIYYFSLGLTSSDLTWERLTGKVYAMSLCIFCTGFFETAYRRCIERQTPAGIGEYEALEGPSLGL